MFREEALWLEDLFARLDLDAGAQTLDVGSSTEYYRRVEQPYIDYHVFRPLRRRGVRALHLDIKDADGVDLVCDLTVPETGPQLKRLPRTEIVLASNLLEHVTDAELVARRLRELTAPAGLLVITVPRVYPYHPDPIDTMLRPNDEELRSLVADGFETVASTVIEIENPQQPAEPRRGFWNFVPYGLFRIQRNIRHPISKQISISAVALRRPAD
jgi:hypothetical protein